jgi:multidrug efflux pump subunit AcrB
MTIIFGLSFATVLTLVVVPAMYTIIFVRRKKRS